MNEHTALQTGFLIGHLMKQGVNVKPIIHRGNYTASLEIIIDMPTPSGLKGEFTQKIIVTVEPPDEA